MLIQTESNTVINTEQISLLPVRDEDGEIVRYDVILPSMHTLCAITPRERDVILHLVTNPPENRVLRTLEWDVVRVGDSEGLNYRYANILAGMIHGVNFSYDMNALMEWLHGEAEHAAEKDCPLDVSINVLQMLGNLARDRSFDRFAVGGREEMQKSINASVAPARVRVKSILDRWFNIFVDLPF